MPLGPLKVGEWIERTHWPQHVTVCPSFRSGPADIDSLAAVLRRFAAAISRPSATVGNDAMFGENGEVSVQLVESRDLHNLHADLTNALNSAARVEPVDPEYYGSGYRPHVTIVDGDRLDPSSHLDLRTFVLVELVPDQTPAMAVPVAVAAIGQSTESDVVTAERGAAVYLTLENHGIRSWVIGGWGIDALLGTQTREHHDIDLFVLDEDVSAMLELVHSSGSLLYLWSENRWHNRLPSAFVAELGGAEVDVHVVALDGASVRIWSAHSIELPSGALTGRGEIAGQLVSCATAEAQLIMHAGYELPAHQQQDLALLRGLLSET